MNRTKYRAAEERLWESVGLVPNERFVRLPRFDTTVRVQEIGEGTPVLFIHGGPNSGSTWAQLVAQMPGFRCILLDRPGTGLSADYAVRKGSLLDFASHLVGEVLDALDVDSSHVVASSLGGFCALRSAVATPERFDRMVQMACPALLPNQPLPPFMKAIMFPGVRKVIRALPPSKKAQNAILRQIGHGKSLDAGKLLPTHDDWYTALTQHTNTMKNDGDLIYSLRARGGFDQACALGADTLAKVNVPTRFLWGADDAFGDGTVARWAVESMPDATLEMIPDSGHLPWIDDPRFVGAETVRFLEAELSATSMSSSTGEASHD